MNEHRLVGLRSHEYSSLLSYLAALGTFRVLASQKDKTARMHWEDGTPMLITRLKEAELVNFFLYDYSPSPILSPWNGGNPLFVAPEKIKTIFDSNHKRFLNYQNAIIAAYESYIEIARENSENNLVLLSLLEQIKLICNSQQLNPQDLANAKIQLSEYFGNLSKDSFGKKAKSQLTDKKIKAKLILTLRSKLSDIAIKWIDSAIIIDISNVDKASPILISGGNDGRFEFSNHFLLNLIDVTLPEGDDYSDSANLLLEALYKRCDTVALGNNDVVVGPFDPTGAGTMNAVPGVDKIILNQWMYVLAFEGILLFASSITRRNDSIVGEPTTPFSVKRSLSIGHPSTSEGEEQFRGEIWTPQWRNPIRLFELERLFGEGRMEWNGKQANYGRDTIRSTVSLGVERGIESFTRYTILERRGRANSAINFDSFFTGSLPEINLTTKFDRWLVDLEKSNLRSVLTAKKDIDNAIYELAKSAKNDSRRPTLLSNFLTSISKSERIVGISTNSVREKINPISKQDANDWIEYLDDGTAEMRVAIGLASLHDFEYKNQKFTPSYYLRPIKYDNLGKAKWRERGSIISGISTLPIVQIFTSLLSKRITDLSQQKIENRHTDFSQPGVLPGFNRGAVVRIGDITDLYQGELNENKIAEIFCGLLLLDWSKISNDKLLNIFQTHDNSESYLPPEWCTLTRFFHNLPITKGLLLTVPSNWGQLLLNQEVDKILTNALERLRIAGFQPKVHKIQYNQNNLLRLAPCLLLHLPYQILNQALNQISYRVANDNK